MSKLDTEQLFSSYYDRLYRFIYWRVPGDSEAAKDIAQDVFLLLAKHQANPLTASSFRGESSAYTWLCAIARRRIIDRYRKNLRRVGLWRFQRHSPNNPENGEDVTDNAMKTPEECYLERETRERVQNCLTSLPMDQRYALILKYMESFSEKEIARIFGKPVKTVESILYRAKRNFSRIWEEEDGNR